MTAHVHTVIGAGALGSTIARALSAQGRHVRVISRTSRLDLPGVKLHPVDIRDQPGLRDAVTGSTTVYQTAQPAYQRWAEEFPSLQTAVVDAAAAAGADLVIADNLYMYGAPGSQPISESSTEQPISRKGRVRQEMAAHALDAHRHGRVRVVLSRPSTYFGPGYDQNGHALFQAAAHRKPMQFLGRLDVPHSYSYLPDVAVAMIALADSDTGWGRAWIPPTQPPLTQGHLAELIWNAAGQTGPPRMRRLSREGARLLGLASPVVRELAEMMYEFDRPYIVDSSEFEKVFGLTATPITDAIDTTMRWYTP